MRLPLVRRGHRLWHRALFRLAPILSGGPIPDVVRTLLYRAEFWGRPQSLLLHRVMRGPSPWTAGERELFAAFCSRQFQCVF
jgi:hypothetical protein